jgi:AcrR family transcriptional regulator
VKDRPKPSRATVLHNLIEEILARNDGQIPTTIEGTDTYFNNIEDLANALLLRWHTRLVASLERSLVDDPEDRREAVIEAWRHATRIYSGVRKVIDDLADHPPTEEVAHAVRATAHNDWAAMAVAAGLASAFDEPAVRVGHRLELEARRRNIVEQSTARTPRPRTVLGKVKAMITG